MKINIVSSRFSGNIPLNINGKTAKLPALGPVDLATAAPNIPPESILDTLTQAGVLYQEIESAEQSAEAGAGAEGDAGDTPAEIIEEINADAETLGLDLSILDGSIDEIAPKLDGLSDAQKAVLLRAEMIGKTRKGIRALLGDTGEAE